MRGTAFLLDCNFVRGSQLRFCITARLVDHSFAFCITALLLHHSFAFASQLRFCIMRATASLLDHGFALGRTFAFGSQLHFWIATPFWITASLSDHSFVFGAQLRFGITTSLLDQARVTGVPVARPTMMCDTCFAACTDSYGLCGYGLCSI